ncbi:hypothetical protein IX84_03430 [Phaeodactylibacter xiamenensis]|uniref:Secretion system C-terminal sorting domain-containing protein n=1 Tax=Phaeodactylibacter xiamenensis TaxID=1524460 RepID=A0A098SEK4_9BACT|nr:hypothetical protein IX84_03430 [Phaeodactylibacter xiamenensis]
MFFQDDDIEDGIIGESEFRGGSRDAFLSVFNSQNSLSYSTYLGGNKNDNISSSLVKEGSLYFVGSTVSDFNFPVLDPGDPAYFEGESLNDIPTFNDAFFGRINIQGVPVSVEEQSSVKKDCITISPNPSQSNITISINCKGAIKEWEIVNVAGQLVASGRFEGNGVEGIDITGLPSGIYVFLAKDDTGYGMSAKFVRQ